MSAAPSSRTRLPHLSFLGWLAVAAVIWLIAAGIVWLQVVYKNPDHVFRGMLENNFSTAGFTRRTASQQNNVNSDERAQLQTGHEDVVFTNTTLTQGKDKVQTEAISNGNNDYVRYTLINTSSTGANGKKLDFSKALNVWAKNDSDPSTATQSFSQLMLGIFPIGNVDSQTRAKLMDQIVKNKVFTIDEKNIKKETINGRPVYTYQVKLYPQPYVTMLKDFAKAVGLGDQVESLNAKDYANTPPTSLTISVDVLSRQLRSVTYNSNATRKESYTGFGIVKPVELPQHTITGQELQRRLQLQ